MKGETYQTVSGILAHAICDVNTLIRIVDPAAYAGICFIHSLCVATCKALNFLHQKSSTVHFRSDSLFTSGL